jgi:hypothetical protein
MCPTTPMAGGLLLIVGTDTFQDPDDMRDFAPKNQFQRVGPDTLEGLKVIRERGAAQPGGLPLLDPLQVGDRLTEAVL